MARGRQTKVSLPDYLRESLENAAAGAERSMSEEIRSRLERSFTLDADPETEKLAAAIVELAGFIRLQTGRNWHDHAGAHWTLVSAIANRMCRLKPPGDPVFAHDELPAVRLVAPKSDDPETMGVAIETVVHHTQPMSLEQLHEAYKRTVRELQAERTKQAIEESVRRRMAHPSDQS